MNISEIITESRIETSIFLVRGHKVLIDADLEVLYGVETRSLDKGGWFIALPNSLPCPL